MQPLTDRQQQVLQYIKDYTAGYGYPPTVREIGEALDILSPNGVADHLNRLESKGYIRRRPKHSRAISIL